MKKTLTLFALVLLALSCKKDEPIGPKPVSVVFYTGTNGAAIDVWIDGAMDPNKPTGTITKYWPGTAPDCNTVGTVTVTFDQPGTHTFNARPKGATTYWSGTITLVANSTCTAKRFDR